MRKTTFQNAEVGLPIFSIGQVAKDKHRVIFDEDEGVIVHKPTGKEIPFIMRNGVYFIKMRVPRALVQPNEGQPNQSFGRRGMA